MWGNGWWVCSETDLTRRTWQTDWRASYTRRKVDKLCILRNCYNRSFKNQLLCFLLNIECNRDNFMSVIVKKVVFLLMI